MNTLKVRLYNDTVIDLDCEAPQLDIDMDGRLWVKQQIGDDTEIRLVVDYGKWVSVEYD